MMILQIRNSKSKDKDWYTIDNGYSECMFTPKSGDDDCLLLPDNMQESILESIYLLVKNTKNRNFDEFRLITYSDEENKLIINTNKDIQTIKNIQDMIYSALEYDIYSEYELLDNNKYNYIVYYKEFLQDTYYNSYYNSSDDTYKYIGFYLCNKLENVLNFFLKRKKEGTEYRAKKMIYHIYDMSLNEIALLTSRKYSKQLKELNLLASIES